MKKHLHKVIAGILIGATVMPLAACAPSNDGSTTKKEEVKKEVPMGRYMEETIEYPTAIKRILECIPKADGSLELYGFTTTDEIVAYTSKDGKSWEEKAIKWSQEVLKKEGSVGKIAVGEDDVTYILYSDKQYEDHLLKVSTDGAIEEIQMEWDAIGGYAMEMAVLPNGDIVVGRQNGGVIRFDGTTGKQKIKFDGLDGEFAIASDKLMQIDIETTEVVIADLETGKEIERIAFEGNGWGNILVTDAEGSLYMINERGISRLAPGGSIWENIVEPGMSSFGMPSLVVSTATIRNKQEFMVAFFSRGDRQELVQYRYDANIPTRPTKEVGIYMLQENLSVKQAAAEYQRINPEVYINLQIGLEAGASITKTDAIRNLNTELLAGKGPDIILLDGLPMNSYIEKGVLQDMSEVIKGKGNWLENIMKPYLKADNKIYAVPTRFKLPLVWGETEITKEPTSINQIAEWADKNPDKQAIYGMTPEQIIRTYFSISAPNWLDATGKIEESAFIPFLEAVKGLAEEVEEESGPSNQLKDKSNEYMAYEDIAVHLQTTGGLTDMMLPFSAMKQRTSGDFNGIISGGKGVFEPSGILGVNNNTEYKDIANEIVKLALSDKVQSLPLGDGYPVNTQAFKDLFDEKKSNGVMSMPMMPANSRPINLQPLDKEMKKKIADYAKQVEVPAVIDEVLMQMIIEETKGYFEGEKSAEEAAKAIGERTKAYLSE